MIPMALLSGKLNFSDGRTLEICFSEMASASFSFRLPHSIGGCLSELTAITFCAFARAERAYHTLTIEKTFFTIEVSENRPDSIAYDVRVCDSPAFSRFIKPVCSDYLDYIDKRLTLDDSELSEAMLGVPAAWDSLFPESREQAIKEYYVNLKGVKTGFTSPYGILLDTPYEREAYLAMPFETYVSDYFKRRALEAHPLASVLPAALVIGSSFCPHREGNLETWISLHEKCRQEGLEFILAIAPSGESLREREEKKLLAFHEYLKENECYVNLLAGDIGMRHFAKERRLVHFHVADGILADKHVKDPRAEHYPASMAVSYDSCRLTDGRRLTFAPFYATNVATFCTLYSAVTRGDRSPVERVLSCPGYCDTYAFLYPQHLKTIGIGNSLLAFDETLLKDPAAYEAAASKGLVVLNPAASGRKETSHG